jgi:hypothetical protein
VRRNDGSRWSEQLTSAVEGLLETCRVPQRLKPYTK